MERRVTLRQANQQLSRYVREVEDGAEVVITRRGRPIAELRPVPAEGTRLAFGCDAGRVVVGKDFDAPLRDMAEYER